MTIRNPVLVFEQPNGESYLNASGALCVLFKTPKDDMKPGPRREAILRFQERVQGLLSAENLRASPRMLADLLYDECGGVQVDAKLRAGDVEGAMLVPLAMCQSS